jgi:thiol-disulfide isomerase/thioredoxin
MNVRGSIPRGEVSMPVSDSRPRRNPGCVVLAMCLLALFTAGPAGALGAGDPAPPVQAELLAGDGMLDLTAYRGKVVYLDFWASWCPPCLTSLPLLEVLRQEFSDDAFQVVAINLDTDPSKALRFLEKVQIGYPSGSDPKGRIPESFGLKTMPTSYLIDGDGVIRHVHEGFRKSDIDSLRRRIEALVAKTAQ